MQMQKKFRVDLKNPSFLIAALIIGVFLAVGGSVLATSVGNSISVTNDLTVSGTATSSFSGGVSTAGLVTFNGLTIGTGNITATSGALTIQPGANNNLLLNPSSTGSIGIGTTTPGSLLSVSGSSGLGVTNTGAGSSFYVQDVANDTSPFLIDSTGNVGIGTTTPGTLLSVQGVGNFVSEATSTFYTPVAAGNFSATTTTATSTFSGGATIATGGGSVGIGTTTPMKTLSVGGSALFGNSSGTTTISASAVGTGVGSCIELRAASTSVMYRIYLGTRAANGGTVPLVVEVGSCIQQ